MKLIRSENQKKRFVFLSDNSWLKNPYYYFIINLKIYNVCFIERIEAIFFAFYTYLNFNYLNSKKYFKYKHNYMYFLVKSIIKYFLILFKFYWLFFYLNFFTIIFLILFFKVTGYILLFFSSPIYLIAAFFIFFEEFSKSNIVNQKEQILYSSVVITSDNHKSTFISFIRSYLKVNGLIRRENNSKYNIRIEDVSNRIIKNNIIYIFIKNFQVLNLNYLSNLRQTLKKKAED